MVLGVLFVTNEIQMKQINKLCCIRRMKCYHEGMEVGEPQAQASVEANLPVLSGRAGPQNKGKRLVPTTCTCQVPGKTTHSLRIHTWMTTLKARGHTSQRSERGHQGISEELAAVWFVTWIFVLFKIVIL